MAADSNSKQVISEIRNQIREVKARLSYDLDNEAFEHWILQTLLDLNDDEAFEAARIRGANRKGVDAFLPEIEDDHISRIFIIRYSEEDPYSTLFESDVVNDAGSAVHWLSDSALDEIDNSGLRIAAAEYHECIRRNFETIVNLVLFGSLSDKAKEQFEETRSKLSQSNVVLKCYQISDIENIYHAWLTTQNEDRVEDEVQIDVISTQNFTRHLIQTDSNGTKALIITIPALELVRLFEKYRYRLFDLNVRYSLGNTDATKAMTDTLVNSDERPLFFAYNNGMTILCDKFELIQNNTKLVLQAPQIVNGCQTTVALHDNREMLDERVAVLARIIDSKTEELSQHIAESTNTQNAVTHRDLRANDLVQKVIQTKFNELIPPYKYLRKRGEWRKLTPEEKRVFSDRTDRGGTSHRRVENEDLAQTFLAFSGKPIEARTQRRKIFIVRGGYYNEIFSEDRSAEEYLLPYLLFKYIGAKKSEFRREYNSAMAEPKELTDSEKATWQARSVLLYASYTILGLMGYLVETRYEKLSISRGYNRRIAKSLLQSFDQVADSLYRICSREVQRSARTILGIKPDYDLSNAHKQPKTFLDLIGNLEIDLSSDPSTTDFLPTLQEV